LVDGHVVAPPTASTLLGGDGCVVQVIAFRDPEEWLRPGALCEIRCDDSVTARFVLGEPDPPELLPGLHVGPERVALLRFLVSTCGPLLRLGSQRDFVALCHGVATATGPEPVAKPQSRPGVTLSIWKVPPSPPGYWYLIERDGIRRVDPAVEEILLVPGRQPAADAVLLPPGVGAVPIGLSPASPKAPSLRDVVREVLAGNVETPPRLAVVLGRRAATDRSIAALLAEAQLLAPARPRGLAETAVAVGAGIDIAISDHGGGVFLAGWLRDPLGLVAGMELRSPIAARSVPAAALRRVARPDLAESPAGSALGAATVLPGFVAHLPDADHPAVAQWRLLLRLRSGEALELVAPPSRLVAAAAREIVLGSVRPAALRPGVLEDAIAPAVSRLHAAALGKRAAPDVVRVGGPPPRRPRATIVVPLYRNLRFLRFQLAAFGRDPSVAAGCEIIYVLDSPEQRSEVELILKGVSLLHGGLPLTLVVMSENRGYASACNAGAAAGRAPVIAMLNSDVLPTGPGWLEPLIERLKGERRLAAVGPKLLFDDGSVQHAGMLFRRGVDGQWLNYHYYKGFPRGFPAANLARRVPAVTGAALVVRRTAFEAVGGFCTDYVVGDFEDSDLCLALRAAGHEIGYEPAVEMLHFERQSISDHSGHARTLAGAYNRYSHHAKWDGQITALMARFGEEY
jgi:GT2 family glycosyltransferase